jgi:two-component system chemotaxis response regulator CheV
MAETNILLESGTNELEVIEFLLSYTDVNGKKTSQPFGINVAKVREIIRMPELTKLPNLPECVFGVFNLRNRIIPALDLSKYLYNIHVIDKNKKMIIAEFNKLQCGFIVDDVQSIHRISWSDIISPDAISDFDTETLSIVGIIKMSDRNILMLDVEKIVADIDPNIAMDTRNVNKTVEWKPKIVTAEDSAVIRKMITDKLTFAGFEVFAYSDGQSAWDKMEEISRKVSEGASLSSLVNVVISDIEMPKMDGYTLTKMIKSDNNLSAVPVILFSSLINNEIRHKGEAVGANYQLTKPQLGELITFVNQLLEQTS